MDKSLALKICPDFKPVAVENKVKCVSYAGNGVCKRPEYFRCELVLYKEEQERLAVTSTISVSRATTILSCPRKYALNYIYHVTSPLEATWKIVGRAFSDSRAKIDMGLQYQLNGDINSIQVAKARLSAVLRRYKEWRRTDLEVMNEVRVFFPHKDTHFIGFIDALTRDRETIIEWKYASTKYDEIKALRQAAVYFHGIPEAKKFILAVAAKPMQRLKFASKPTKKNPNPQNETPFELEQRIYEELESKKDTLFTYTEYDRNFFDIPAVIEQIYQVSTLIKAFEAAGYPAALGMACENCDFRPYCLKHLTEIGCSRNMCSHPSICDTIRKVNKMESIERKFSTEIKQITSEEENGD